MSTAPHVSWESTLQVRDACLCLHAQRAARALARRFDDALRPLDLTNGQFSLLMALNRPLAPSMGQVAEVLAMDRTTLTAALKPLVRRGLVESGMNENDKRSRRLEMTPLGKNILAAAFPIWVAAHTEVEASLPSKEAERLRRGLRALSLDAKASKADT